MGRIAQSSGRSQAPAGRFSFCSNHEVTKPRAINLRQCWQQTTEYSKQYLVSPRFGIGEASARTFVIYSCRRASIGSIAVARRAGTTAASVVTAAKMIKTLMNVHGSRGVTPKSIVER
jgi:hypothetical protein